MKEGAPSCAPQKSLGHFSLSPAWSTGVHFERQGPAPLHSAREFQLSSLDKKLCTEKGDLSSAPSLC